jgi:hypothetical protein
MVSAVSLDLFKLSNNVASSNVNSAS